MIARLRAQSDRHHRLGDAQLIDDLDEAADMLEAVAGKGAVERVAIWLPMDSWASHLDDTAGLRRWMKMDEETWERWSQKARTLLDAATGAESRPRSRG